MKIFKLLLLDLDDTVLDNRNADLESFKYVLKNHKIKPPTEKQLIDWRKNGMLAKNMFKRIIGNNTELTQKCIESRLEFLKNKKNFVYLKPKEDTYSSLKKISDSLDIVIITSRDSKKNVWKILKQCKLSKFVKEVFCAEDLKNSHYTDYIELKEKLYKLAINKFKYKKTQILVVGNLKSDIIAGKNLEIKTCGVRGSYRFDSDLKNITDTAENLETIMKKISLK